MQHVVAEVPWAHNVILQNKLRDAETRLWYVSKAHEEGWSRNILAVQIESRLHERTGKATTNFLVTLPPEDFDLPTLLIAATAIEDGLDRDDRGVRYFEPTAGPVWIHRSSGRDVPLVGVSVGHSAVSLRLKKSRFVQAMRLERFGLCVCRDKSTSRNPVV